MTRTQITIATIVAVTLIGGGYVWWSRAPAEPVDQLQRVATDCEDALEAWGTIRADPAQAKSRRAKDALEAAERCQYKATAEDVSFTTP